VTWKQIGTGGSTITGYRVQLSRSATGAYTVPARGTCEGALPNRTCRITGLIEGAMYYVRVRAISRVGAGPWGLSKPIRTLARPDIRLAFGGDVHFEGAASAQAGAGGLRTLPQIFAGADVSMVNLETAIATSASSPVSKEYNFRAPAKVLGTLAAAGVDVVTEANNHSVDYGASGLRTTLSARAHSPIPVVGIGSNTADAIKPWVTEVKGTSIAVFGMVGLDLTYEENAAVARTWPATPKGPGIAVWHNHSAQILAAVTAWAEKVDVVVVYAHWGEELATCPDAAQLREAALLSKAGASVIIGAHPHVLQGSGWMGHSVVAYSLGNFAWYSTAGRPTGAFFVQVSHGKPSNFSWRPTTYTGSGLPILVKGSPAADTRALLAERSAPGCSGLTAKPGAKLALTVRPCTSSLRPSERAVPGFE
jgi:poly-gamma-glutamate synthesis protein (capsule biosynthesis protein)